MKPPLSIYVLVDALGWEILRDRPFLDDVLMLRQRLAGIGRLNGLAQTLLKLTCPGVPDIYQGCELWQLDLVDPDNRRPVDYARRRALPVRRPVGHRRRTPVPRVVVVRERGIALPRLHLARRPLACLALTPQRARQVVGILHHGIIGVGHASTLLERPAHRPL